MDNDVVFARYYNLALRYLSYRPRSEQEVLDYLKTKQKKSPNLSNESIEKILVKLREYRFIDDEKFTQFWIEQRTKYKRKPIKVVKFELVQKGIDKNLINENFEKLEDNNFDFENAKSLAKKKMEFYRNLPVEKREEKVMNYLLRKGFNYDIVKKVVKD